MANGDLDARQQALLLFLAAGDREPLDPIRIQKGMFIFAQEAPADWLPHEGRYQFVPWHWGPFSAEIYSDLERLERLGHISSEEAPGYSWRRYRPTPGGADLAHCISETMMPDALRFLGRLRHFVQTVSFRRLLEQVYKRYPQYATNSLFRVGSPSR